MKSVTAMPTVSHPQIAAANAVYGTTNEWREENGYNTGHQHHDVQRAHAELKTDPQVVLWFWSLCHSVDAKYE